MRCPECDAGENRVVDTRTSREGRAVRRRRECTACGSRFTTYEYVEARPIQVLKRDGSAQEFDRAKLLESITTAAHKRPLSPSDIEQLVDEVEDELSRDAGVEVLSSRIGDLVMERLKALDRVTYVRFASVYRDFQDIDEFQDVVEELDVGRKREAQARNQVELPL